ncbi:MAG: hypothetical protein KDJ50_06455 [Alphaproteobacteria bacterium]|nr:hypothetical protein [Alphaproteobacteria bacterium]
MKNYISKRMQCLLAFLFFANLIFLCFCLGNSEARGQESVENRASDRMEETLPNQAASIYRFPDPIIKTLNRILNSGMNFETISFEHSGNAGYSNPKCVNSLCRVFSDSGEGIYTPPLARWLDASHSSEPHFGEWIYTISFVEGIRPRIKQKSGNVQSENPDLLVILPWVKEDLCRTINMQLGIPDEVMTVPSSLHISSTFPLFDGGNIDHGQSLRVSEGHNLLRGNWSGCFHDSIVKNGYHFYKVLIPQ